MAHVSATVTVRTRHHGIQSFLRYSSMDVVPVCRASEVFSGYFGFLHLCVCVHFGVNYYKANFMCAYF